VRAFPAGAAMEIHLPGHVRTFRDFCVHLGIITLGSLIALGLEQVVEAHHRAKIGRETVVSFRGELAYDRQQVLEVMAATAGLRGQLQTQIAVIEAEREPAAKAAIPIEYPQIHFDYIASASWETAIATQALYYIPAADAKRFSEAYGVFSLFMDEERGGLAAWQNLRRFGTDAGALTPEQRRALVEELRRYESFTYVIDMIGKGTLQACDRALQ
jgi:hypothetical protein